MMAFLVVFLAICGLSFVIYLRSPRDERQGVSRLRQLKSEDKGVIVQKPREAKLSSALLKLGRLLIPQREERLGELKTKLIQAGLYSPTALRFFLAAKLILMVTLPVLALIPYWFGMLSREHLVLAGLMASSMGIVIPNYWLSYQVAARHRVLRSALPDALDMLVLCLEGGVSLVAAFQRVTGELQAAHPVLGREMNILQREIQMGLSAGESLKKLGERCGLQDVRELAKVLLQSERFGASVIKALKTHAESWRMERQQRAEELAQKAAVKIIFPTLLCIFPAIFIVLLGPAAFQMSKLLSK